MKRIVILIVYVISAIIAVSASTYEAYTMYGFASEISGFPAQPFSDIKQLEMPNDDPELPYRFWNQLWEYQEEISDKVDLFVSTTTNDKLIFDSREIYGPDVLVIIVVKGNIKYYYTDDLQAVQNNQTSASNSQYDSGVSNGNYSVMYDKWESRARDAYNSLTNASVSSTTYVRNKKLLREAQREMRKIRQKASAAGVTIHKSKWEDAQVKLH